jgi:predicted DNA-binding protein
MSMLADLKVRIEQELLERAEAFSRRTGKSVSEIISEYLQRLPEPSEGPAHTAPIVRSLRGALRGSSLTEEDYRRYLERKYR